ncbi:TlpA family protein disulfide reductase [Candidatus Sumerlaeota bacterium]|nr:TlpA family protein disulfide reductase [Candidatus Sumerlaeota bacterium]
MIKDKYSGTRIIKGITVIVVISFLVLTLGIWTGCSKESPSQKTTTQKKSTSQVIGKPESAVPKPANWGDAPDFTLPKLGGGSFTLSSLRGKVIILNFWATWCKLCRKEIPYLISLQTEYKDKGLEIVGVSLDKGKEKAVSPMAERLGINYPIVFSDHKIERKYGVSIGLPVSIIIDRNGNIAGRHLGEFSEEVFEKKVKPLLEKETGK